jgi:hypothetical protein
VTIACSQLGTDLDQVVALEMVFPDSGRIDVNDTLRPHARALNGRGDSVAATVIWASLDTAIMRVIDSTTGVAVAESVGTARLQARAGTLRSNPQNVFVLPPLDSARADSVTRDTVVVSAPDSLSDSLVVRVFAAPEGTNPLASRRVVYAIDSIYSSGVTTVTFVPRDTVKTNVAGKAAARVQFLGGTVPDSIVVFATVGSFPPIRFVVEFRP